MCIMRITAELSCREKEGMSMEYLIVDIITVVLGIYLLYDKKLPEQRGIY